MNRALRTAMGWLAVSGLLSATAQATELVNIYDSSTLLTQATVDGQEAPVVSEDIDLIDQATEEATGIEMTNAIEATPAVDSTVKGYETSSFGKGKGCDACAKNCCPKRRCCCDPCCCWRPFVGTAASFLAPIHNRTGVGALAVVDPVGTTLTTVNSDNVGGMTVNPRLWAGVQGPRWGGVVRYWRFVDDQGGLGPQGLGPFQASQGHLQLQTLDIEAIRAFTGVNHRLWLTVGARHAQYQQNGGATSSALVGPALITGNAFNSNSFYGTGVTNSIFGTCRIDNTNWSWFYGGRTSFLWDGNARSTAVTTVSYTDPLVAAAAINGASFSNSSDMFIGEAQLGFQYDHALVAVPMNAFFRIAAEYQYWNLNMHGGASAVSFAGNPANAIGVATARAGGATLDLLGFNVATGFWW